MKHCLECLIYLLNRNENLGVNGEVKSSKSIDPLHKWRLHLNNNTHTSLASHSCEKSFVLKHEYEAKDVSSIVIQIYTPFMQRVYAN